jgi:hypothetical protein
MSKTIEVRRGVNTPIVTATDSKAQLSIPTAQNTARRYTPTISDPFKRGIYDPKDETMYRLKLSYEEPTLEGTKKLARILMGKKLTDDEAREMMINRSLNPAFERVINPRDFLVHPPYNRNLFAQDPHVVYFGNARWEIFYGGDGSCDSIQDFDARYFWLVKKEIKKPHANLFQLARQTLPRIATALKSLGRLQRRETKTRTSLLPKTAMSELEGGKETLESLKGLQRDESEIEQ